MPAAVRELIADVPAPRSHHRKDKSPALREQYLVKVRIVRAGLLRHVGNIKLDRSTTAGFEVDEQQAGTRVAEVAGMRFAVQELLGSAAAVTSARSGV